MIRGNVNARREAMLSLRLRRDAAGPEMTLDVLLDTGFTGALTLPAGVIAGLNLSPQSAGEASLADGSVVRFELYAVDVAWDNGWRTVLASTIGNEL